LDANLSDAVEDRLESVVDDVDGGNVVLAGVAFLGSATGTSTESSSDSLSVVSRVSTGNGSGTGVFLELSKGVLDLLESLESSLFIELTLSLRSVSDDVDAVLFCRFKLYFQNLN